MLLTGACLFLWALSARRTATLMHIDTVLHRDPSVADGHLRASVIDVVARAVETSDGSLVLRRSLSTSLREHRPASADVEDFARNDGWGLVTTTDAGHRARRLRPRFYDTPFNWRFMQLGLYESASAAATHMAAEAPLWLIAAVVAAPAAGVGRYVRRRRRRIHRGQFPACGYDLTCARLACPECGATVLRVTSTGV